MESKDDTTHASTEGTADEASKRQFLDALLAAGHEDSPSEIDRESNAGDSVALSSNPDLDDLPGAPVGPSNARSESTISPNKPDIMYSIERGSSQDDADEPVANESETTNFEDDNGNGDDSDLLLLSCPKCDGQLALREEHIGVEGSCVWCDAPIVAGRSGGDRSVKVFAIATETEAKVESPEARPPEASSPEEEEETQSTPVQQPADFSENDLPTGWGSPAPIEEKSETEETKPSPEDSSESESEKPEAPAPSDSFDTVADASSESDSKEETFEGFTSPELDTDSKSTPEHPSQSSGFGEFLSSASGSPTEIAEPAPAAAPEENAPSDEQTKTEDFSSPTPWGPPTQPAAPEPETATEDEPPASPPVENGTAAIEFSELAETDSPSQPEPASDVTAPSDWAPPESPSHAAPSDQTPDPSAGFGAPTSFDEAPAALANKEPETQTASTNESKTLFSPAASNQPETENAGEGMPVGFNIPSEETPSAPFPAFGPTDAPPASLIEAEDSGTPKDESLPIFEANEDHVLPDSGSVPASAPLFAAKPQGNTSLFGPSPEKSKAPAEEASSNPPGEEKVAELPKPVENAPSAEESETKAEESAAPAPQKVDSVTLGKKKRGKGFFIITTIMLGLVCGAALASFVLPIDEYVNQARSMMEKKFMPSASWESAENFTPPGQPTLESQPTPQSQPALESQPAPQLQPALESQPTPQSQPALESQPTPQSQPALESQPTPQSQPAPAPSN